jgi:hypothetical protein
MPRRFFPGEGFATVAGQWVTRGGDPGDLTCPASISTLPAMKAARAASLLFGGLVIWSSIGGGLFSPRDGPFALGWVGAKRD